MGVVHGPLLTFPVMLTRHGSRVAIGLFAVAEISDIYDLIAPPRKTL
jgi:hypothetical protein